MTDDHHQNSLRVRLWIGGALSAEEWFDAGDPAAPARAELVSVAHSAAVDRANAAGVPWLVEVWDPEMPRAEAFLRFGTDGRIPSEARFCHCLCSVTHPDQPGICEVEQATVQRPVESALLGVISVPVCAPCSVAMWAKVPAAAGDGAVADARRTREHMRRWAGGEDTHPGET